LKSALPRVRLNRGSERRTRNVQLGSNPDPLSGAIRLQPQPRGKMRARLSLLALPIC